MKPRSPNQRANIERLKRTSTFVPPVSPGPATSWWAGVSRAELHERVVHELPRMATSRFGRLLGSGAIQE